MNKNERIILISSKRPVSLEGNIIYVVRREGLTNDVEVLSEVPFNYRNFALGTSPVMETSQATNLVGDLKGYWHVPIDIVLKTLQEENNARVFSS